MATPKSSDYLDRVYTKIVKKNTSEYQTQIDALEKNLAAFKAKAKATIAAATATDMEKALNKLVEMGAIDDTERDAAYKKFGIKKAPTPRKSTPAVDSDPCGRGSVAYRPTC